MKPQMNTDKRIFKQDGQDTQDKSIFYLRSSAEICG